MKKRALFLMIAVSGGLADADEDDEDAHGGAVLIALERRKKTASA